MNDVLGMEAPIYSYSYNHTVYDTQFHGTWHAFNLLISLNKKHFHITCMSYYNYAL